MLIEAAPRRKSSVRMCSFLGQAVLHRRLASARRIVYPRSRAKHRCFPPRSNQFVANYQEFSAEGPNEGLIAVLSRVGDELHQSGGVGFQASN